MSKNDWKFETLQLHAGQEQPDPATDARAVPIYLTSSFVFKDAATAAGRFGLTEPGNIYSRLTNPTVSTFEERVAALEGGVGSLGVATGSAAITIAVQNIATAGDHIVSSTNLYGGTLNLFEHTLAEQGLSTTFVNPADLDAVEAAIQDNTKLLYAETLGNPNSDVLDLEAWADIAHRHNVPLIVDASQSAGILPINMKSLGAAYIAMPGHKGLYGPQGTGVLLCGDGQIPRPLLEGGTGSISLSQEMPDFLPDRLEAGTHNMPGIAGLLAGVRFVRRQGTQTILRHEHALTCRTAESLRRLPGVEVFAHPGCLAQAGVVSFRVTGRDVETVGEALARRGIAVRAGLHCAPLAHRTAGTLDTGTVRVSFSAFNTPQEADRLAEAVGDILRR